MRDVFTTGQVAKICRVASRTVSIWFDKGMLHGYRIPGSQDRRIPRVNLLKFMKDNGIPTNGLEGEGEFRVLTIGMDTQAQGDLAVYFTPEDPVRIKHVHTWFDAGAATSEFKPDFIVFDFASGRTTCFEYATKLKPQGVLLFALVGEDETDFPAVGELFDGHAQKPYDIATIGGIILDEANQKTNADTSVERKPYTRKKATPAS